ncbi:MAG: hypothetical protein JWQ64_2190 [Subtercola sp.]|nr:hypothetical protein [Subtercola sp.]
MSYNQFAPQPKPSRTGLWIVLGSVGLLAFVGLVVVVVIVSTTILGAVLSRAASPQFSAADASTVLLTSTQSRAFGEWSEPQTSNVDVAEAQSELASGWKSDSPSPSSLPCEFAYSLYPVTNLESGAQETQPVLLNDQFLSVDTDSTFSQSTRVFASTAEAAAYITEMRQLIDGCTSYSTSSWSATVAPLPLDSISLNHAGWVETGTGDNAGGYYFASDIQRGNVVTRVLAQAGSNDHGMLNRSLFTAVVTTAASNLQALRPGSGGGSGGGSSNSSGTSA